MQVNSNDDDYAEFTIDMSVVWDIDLGNGISQVLVHVRFLSLEINL